ncbi:MAG: segregation/condensation protein A [Solobacterium sp.]|nr:chromosome segregation protein ScpA [Erysipelotrichaceae bacterium]MBQ9152394.1 segregation/condensation protein A [Solobacterium sp.]
MEEFKVTIENFEGPLDLMLHLIKEKELDLFDLDVNILTDQYVAYLNAMQEMHLEIASEYLVELADLIEYKSKRLLPKDDSELNDEYEEDPKERLIRRLLEYQQFKEVSSELNRLYDERQQMMSKPLSSEAEEWMNSTEDVHYRGNPNDLFKAMRKVMMRMRLARPIETRYTSREISMEDRELEVRAKLDRLPKTFRFEALLDDCEDLPMFIATFLAVLDLARQHILAFTVDDEDVIWFSRGTGL